MTDLDFRQGVQPDNGPQSTTNLADILERVLDKGIVIAGDIKIDLLDIELLTIRLRLFVASVDTAKKAGIDWWETDPALSSKASRSALEDENRQLRERLQALEPVTDETDAPYRNTGRDDRGDRDDSKETGQR
ncbi:gas vesicle protein [Streptomyces sp. CB00316]|uniref:gas vesicle protein n=1 Tax=Streptomyces sp. CB00316 TaxID=1703932 RepID=UPI00093A3C6C|nr:gas vesicle protein [Streptomyces sp. CB00316]OKJ20693.1 gas vesicle protein [Streptomyces sp. CB00316]